MIPDPNTPEGRLEIERRVKQLKSEGKAARSRAENNPNEEVGALTQPNELDLHRDRKDCDGK